mgnify:CR=1 FL=1
MKVKTLAEELLMSHNKEKLLTPLSRDISEQALTEKTKTLSNEMTPERDLWSGIERAISQKSQQSAESQAKSHTVPLAWAASFLVAILISWLTFSPQMQPNSKQALLANVAESPVVAEQLVAFMQNNFQQQKEAMLVSFGQPNLTQLPQAMQQELQQLAAARKSIREALLKDENNVDLLNLLDFTQQQELKLLTQLYRQYQVI